MKVLNILLITMLFSLGMNAQVFESKQELSVGLQNAYALDHPNADKKMVEEALENAIKEYGKVKRNKKAKEWYCQECKIPTISSNPMNIYYKIEEGKGQITSYLFFDDGGQFLSSDNGTAEADIERFNMNIFYDVKRMVISKELEDQEDQLKDYNKALSSFSEAMALSQTQRDPKTMVSILNNIGYTYIEAGEYESAEKFLRGSATLNKNIKAINAAPYKGLGNLFLLKTENDSAEVNYKKALEIYIANHNIKEEIEVRDKLIAIAIMSGDYTTALDHQILRDSLQLTVSNLEKDRLLNFANVNYEVKQKETEISHQKEINNRNQLLLASAIMLFVFILIATGFYIYNTKLKAANKASKLEQSLLRVQMNPHFIFNTLAAIQNITLEGNPIKSSNYIARFSKLIRQNFDYVRKESISLDKEISMIKNYIETQQLRFNNVFSYTIEIEDSLDVNSINVPPMLLQPFVENAIEYGLKEKKDGGELLLKIEKDPEGLLFVIIDNGLGRSAKAKKEKLTEELHATTIFLERLKMRKKGEEKSFMIEDLFDEHRKPTGTKVFFKLKL